MLTTTLLAILAAVIAVLVVLVIYLVDRFNGLERETQRMIQGLQAQQAIDAAQRLADRISWDALKLSTPFTALQFLRDELAAQAQEEEGEPAEGDGKGDAAA